MDVWEQNYQTMPLSDLRDYLERWERITRDAVALKGVADAEWREHIRTCKRNLALVRRVARERGLVV